MLEEKRLRRLPGSKQGGGYALVLETTWARTAVLESRARLARQRGFTPVPATARDPPSVKKRKRAVAALKEGEKN